MFGLDVVVVIEPGAPADVASLRWAWGLERSNGEATQAGPDQGFTAEVARWMSGGSRTVWTAHAEGRAVGMVCLTEFQRMPSPAPDATGAWGYLGHLYVLPQARGRNIGTELVMALLSEARSRRYSKVVLSPTEESVPLYRRCGFGADHGLLMSRP